MLIYKTLGSDAQSQFAQTWGIGYGMDNATEWQEVFKTALKTAVVLVILDLLRLSKNATWFEVRHPNRRRCEFRASGLKQPDASCRAQEHADFVSMQAVLFNGAARSWWSQTRTLVRLQSRLTED